MSCSSSSVRRVLVLAAVGSAAVPLGSARAATWGSFDASRMAYATGTLEGTAHPTLRGLIEANGDEVGPSTGELTPEYLATVDVFYTAMLSDGTGPSAGSPGTLSAGESTALQAWIADGGTLIVTADSNGFDGPFPLVYDSWLSDFGVTDFGWEFSFASGDPLVVHSITDGIGSAAVDGYCTFTVPPQGDVIATIDAGVEPYLVVFEPVTGFDAGGRILVAADHNAFTETYIGDADNEALAQNIVEWAAGECGNGIVEGDEECDDGNLDDGDECSSTCLGGAGGESTGGEGTGDDSTGGGMVDGTTGEETGPQGTTTLPGDDGGSTQGFEDTDHGEEGSPQDDEPADEGCSCRGGDDDAPGAAVLPLVLTLGLRRRRSTRS